MTARGPTRLAWIAGALVGLSLLLSVVAVVLVLIVPASNAIPAAALLNDATTAVTSLPAAFVGALVLWRRANPVGAILLGFGLLGTALGASQSYGAYVGVIPPPTNDPRALSAIAATGWWSVIGALAWLAGLTLVLLLLQVFPDGRLLGPRWRGLLWLTLLFPVVLVGLTELGVEPGATGPAASPFGPGGSLSDAVATARAALGPAFALLGLLSLLSALLRFRRSDGRQRAQLKWFVYGAALAGAVITLTGPLRTVGYVINGLAFCIIPAAIGVAILRHRLYDIDLLIRRTVSYATTSAALAFTFFAAIVILEALLRPLTAGSEAAVAISTLVAVALFQPIRRRVQDAVDRRFDRSRYDAARTLDSFAVALRDEMDLESVRADLMGAVSRTVAPDHASLWLRERAP